MFSGSTQKHSLHNANHQPVTDGSRTESYSNLVALCFDHPFNGNHCSFRERPGNFLEFSINYINTLKSRLECKEATCLAVLWALLSPLRNWTGSTRVMMGESRVAIKHSTHPHQDATVTFPFVSTFPSAFLSHVTLFLQSPTQADAQALLPSKHAGQKTPVSNTFLAK